MNRSLRAAALLVLLAAAVAQNAPTYGPTARGPTYNPTGLGPTYSPTGRSVEDGPGPSAAPTVSAGPTDVASNVPSALPSSEPTRAPTAEPTGAPTTAPTSAPTTREGGGCTDATSARRSGKAEKSVRKTKTKGGKQVVTDSSTPCPVTAAPTPPRSGKAKTSKKGKSSKSNKTAKEAKSAKETKSAKEGSPAKVEKTEAEGENSESGKI